MYVHAQLYSYVHMHIYIHIQRSSRGVMDIVVGNRQDDPISNP